MPQKITRYNKDKIPELIEVMKTKLVTSSEIADILEMPVDKMKYISDNVAAVVSYLAIDYPIYDAGHKQYGLLTRERLEKTEKEELERRQKLNNKKSYNYNDITGEYLQN